MSWGLERFALIWILVKLLNEENGVYESCVRTVHARSLLQPERGIMVHLKQIVEIDL